LQNTVPGFICAYRFDGDGRATVLTAAEASAGKMQETGWVWLHLNFTDSRCGLWLTDRMGVPSGAAKRLVEPAAHQEVARLGQFLIGHVSDFRREFDADSTEHAWTHFLLGPDFLVTGRTKAVQSAERLRKDLSRGRRFAAPANLLVHLVGNYPDTLDAVLHRLIDELEVIEDHILDDRHRGERRRLMLVRRETAQLHRHVRALRRALLQALRTVPEMPEGFDTVAERLSHLDQDFESLELRARFFHDEIDAKLAAETNRQLYTLSALTALFLPPTLVAGLFGMNFPWLPWGDSNLGFWIVLGICLLSSAMVWMFLFLRNRG
jgi:zinc transporter